ncbi:NnrS family protein [Thioalkalivibrio sulfidiphilus]|uniref:NnrS family protein n=1 Tax=Thioalkalivibrio sulfidiphilus TaxID=1033854 RepID=UPI003B2F77AD
MKHFGLHALFLCGFRPFFLAAVLTALVAMSLWGGFLFLGLPLPPVTGGPLVWHGHEMILGFGVAALVGFLLTATPELTDTPPIPRKWVILLVALWLLARLGYAIGGHGQWLTAFTEIGLLGLLAALIAPRLWNDPQRRHLAFLWAVLLLWGGTLGFHLDALRGHYPMRWLLAAAGLFMALIVLAMSRISMRIVNEELKRLGRDDLEYLSRPPRRNLTVFCIGAYTLAELLAPLHPVSGWLALAAAAAVFNLTNDWHLGRPLFRRWILMLYVVYWLIALGYLVLGLSILTDTVLVGAGRHLLMIGGLGGAAFMVMNIAGRIHVGLALERRPWLPLAMGALMGAALVRAGAAYPGSAAGILLLLAMTGWLLAFALLLIRLAPLWLRPRGDGGAGCAGPSEQ